VVATSALKNAQNFTDLAWSLVVVSGYVCAFYFLSLALRTVPLAIAYAIWSGAGIAIIALVGWLYYGERLSPLHLAGLAFILSGILILKLGK
jgi:small multidrug resistance pump